MITIFVAKMLMFWQLVLCCFL